jgi:hypothetical protein
MGCGASMMAASPGQDVPSQHRAPSTAGVESQEHRIQDGRSSASRSASDGQATPWGDATHFCEQPAHGGRGAAGEPSDESSRNLFEKLCSQMDMGFKRRTEAIVQEVFEKFTSPGYPGIVKAKLLAALTEAGIHARPEDEDDLFYAHNMDNDKCINLAEFRLILNQADRVQQWASTLPLAQLLADCMPSRNEEDPLRAISRLSRTNIQVIARCYSQGLARLLEEDVDKLRRAYEDMDLKMAAVGQSEAPSKFEVVSNMSCGVIEDFRGGLRSRIGDASLDFLKAMEAEHRHAPDSKKTFQTANYAIRTCPRNEWCIVVNHDESLADMRGNRVIPVIDDLLQLEHARKAQMTKEEMIAVVLYTGPMYQKYNCVLRRWPEKDYKEMAAQGGAFTTTIHVLVSAVQKLASVVRIPDSLKLYRGLGGVTNLPEYFFKPNSNGGRGFTEWGFMSTTSDKQVALRYSSEGSGQTQAYLPMVLEISVGAINRGACIEAFSQYPKEREYLWVPCSFAAPDGADRMEVTEFGVVRVVPVKVNSNLTALTLEQMLAYKKQSHLAAFLYILQELQRDLSRTCQEMGAARLAMDVQGKEFKCELLVENILEQCRKMFEAHKETKEDVFTNDEAFRGLVNEMLDVKTMAKSKLQLWIEDTSQSVTKVEALSLSDAHQELLSFLHKRMLAEDKDAKAKTAMEICRITGLADKSVELIKSAALGHVHNIPALIGAGADIDFRNEDGSTPLHVAAQNGKVDVMKKLLEARAYIDTVHRNGGGTPLCMATQNGHTGAVRVLLESRAHVNAARDEDGLSPICIAAKNGCTEVATLLLKAKAKKHSCVCCDRR